MTEPEIVRVRRAQAVQMMTATAAPPESMECDRPRARTFCDVLAERGEESDVDVRCPCCRRVVPAWATADVTGLPEELRGGHVYLCEVCIGTMRLRADDATRAEIAACLVAPAGGGEAPEDGGGQEVGQCSGG